MNRTFLADVAHDLWRSYGEDVQSLVMLFPSRRAGMFFREALADQIKSPIWSPNITSIDQIAERLCGLTTGDRIRMVAELFKIYSQYPIA